MKRVPDRSGTDVADELLSQRGTKLSAAVTKGKREPKN